MKLKRIIANVCVAAFAASLFAVAGCGSSNGDVTDVRVAYFPNITHAQGLVMKNSGALEDALGEDYNVSWTSFNAGSSEIEAIFAEEIDIGYIGPVPAINGNVKSDGDVVIIANASDAGAVLVARTDAGISSVADLDGKKVAIPQTGNTQHLCLLALLTEAGLSPVSDGGTVEVVAVENSNLQNLFDQGNVDAALVPEPWGSILTASDNVDLVLDYDQIFLDGNYPVACIVARKEFLDEHPDVVEEFLRLHSEITDEMNASLDDFVDAINAEIEAVSGAGYDRDVILSSFARTNLTTKLNMDALEAFADTAYEQGFISDMPGDGLVDTSILDSLGN